MTRREQQRAAQNKRCKSHLGSSVVFFSERVFPVVLFFVVCGEEEDDFAQPMRTSHLVSVLTFVSFVWVLWRSVNVVVSGCCSTGAGKRAQEREEKVISTFARCLRCSSSLRSGAKASRATFRSSRGRVTKK